MRLVRPKKIGNFLRKDIQEEPSPPKIWKLFAAVCAIIIAVMVEIGFYTRRGINYVISYRCAAAKKSLCPPVAWKTQCPGSSYKLCPKTYFYPKLRK